MAPGWQTAPSCPAWLPLEPVPGGQSASLLSCLLQLQSEALPDSLTDWDISVTHRQLLRRGACQPRPSSPNPGSSSSFPCPSLMSATEPGRPSSVVTCGHLWVGQFLSSHPSLTRLPESPCSLPPPPSVPIPITRVPVTSLKQASPVSCLVGESQRPVSRLRCDQ